MPASLARSIAKATQLERGDAPREALAILEPHLADAARHGRPNGLAARLYLAASDCFFRMASYAQDLAHTEKALEIAEALGDMLLRCECGIHRARILYQQGHLTACLALSRECAQAALALEDCVLAARSRLVESRVQMMRRSLPESEAAGLDGLELARRGGDAFWESMLENCMGIHYFYRVLEDALPGGSEQFMAIPAGAVDPADPRLARAQRHFEAAIALCGRIGIPSAGYEGNAIRVRVLQGDAASTLAPFRNLMRRSQSLGDRAEEIHWRCMYGWALRSCGHFAEALHQLDTAFNLAKKAGVVTRVVQLLHYDRSLVLAALGDFAGALKSYDRYARFHAAHLRRTAANPPAGADIARAVPRPPLEPFYLKRADQFLAARGTGRLSIEDLARHCGVSTRTLQASFKRFRGVSPVTHARNLRLEAARRDLGSGTASVTEAARAHGFGSVTTFSLEYRRRFGEPPRATRAEARRQRTPDVSGNAESSAPS